MILFGPERRRIVAAFLLIVASCLPAAAQERRGNYTPPALDSIHAVAAEHGMVVAQEKIAARIGADVLRRGGNAVDAAVATGFAMAVTYPRAGNIGGGGFMVIHSADRHEDVAIDYRETAPGATTSDIFLGADGKPDNAKSRDSALGIGVPGTVAGLALALEKYGSGKFTLADLLQPAIALARDGLPLEDDMADTLPGIYRRLARWPATAKIFSRAEGGPLHEGDLLVQSDLAATLDGNRRAGSARILPGAGRREAGKGGARRRRDHDGRGSEILCRRDPHAGARQLSRLRYRLDAAVLVRRRGAAGDAEHPRRLSACRHEAGLRAGTAYPDRGDEARLCRSRALSRRSRLYQRARAWR